MNATPHPRLIASLLFERESSSHPAVVCAERSITLSYAELARLAKELAATLKSKDLRPRDRVAILLPNSIEFAVAFFAAQATDAVVMPLDIHQKMADLLAIVAVTRPRLVVTTPGLYRKLGAGIQHPKICLLELEHNPAVSFRLVDPEPAQRPGALGSRLVHEESTPPESPPQPTSPDADAVMILSSGTTGIPKAVRLSHQAILRNIHMHLESLAIAEEIRGLQWLPLNYSYGLIACFLSILQSGGTAVLLPNLDPASVRRAIEQYHINLMMGTPALFQYLIEKSPATADFGTTPIRYVTVGGDRCKRYALDLLHQRLPKAKVYLTYGLTEAGPRVSTLPPELAQERPQSVGLPLKGVEVSIEGDSGAKRGPRELGEIVLRTPCLMNGYFGDPERTRRVIRNGRCHTGDIGYLDERGFLYCVGRKDRQFKFGGRLVNPSVIEQCVSAHPRVQEVAVFKIDNEQEERICAKIKARTARPEELLPELRRLCRKHMPSYLIPGEFRFEDNDLYYHKGKPLVEKGN